MASGKNNVLAIKSNITIEHSALQKGLLILRAAGHPLRKQILALLDEKKKMPVTDIYVKLRQEQSVISQHLAVMRKAGIVTTEKDGKFVYYTLNKKRIGEISDFVDRLTL